jgi:L-fuconolactonase
MKLADAHLHLFRQGYAPRYGAAWANSREVELYEAFRRVHGIEHALVVGFEGRAEFHGNNRDIAIWAKKHSWITPLAFMAILRKPTPKLFESGRRQGFAGIALYVMTRRQAEQLNRWPRSTIQWLNEHSQIVSVNAVPQTLAQLQPFLSRLERCTTLISHLGLPGRFTKPPSRRNTRMILQPLRSLAKFPHVGVKLSGLYAISEPSHAYPHPSAHPFISELFETFGPRRLYWGSDFSPVLEHISFPQTIDVVLRFGWAASDLQNIMHGNLTRAIRKVRNSNESLR